MGEWSSWYNRVSFSVEIGGKVLEGVVKLKEDAANDYDDSISSGGGAYLLELSENTSILADLIRGRKVHGFYWQFAFWKAVHDQGISGDSCVTVLQITYVTELAFENGSKVFELPSLIAPSNVGLGEDPGEMRDVSCAVKFQCQIDVAGDSALTVLVPLP